MSVDVVSEQTLQQGTVLIWVFSAQGFAQKPLQVTTTLLSVDAEIQQNHQQSTVFVWVFGATGFARHLRRVTAINVIFVLFYYALSYVCGNP